MVSKIVGKQKHDWILWTILLVALLFRVLFLAIKPPHFDEGINGWFVDQLIARGYYRYDPTNYHGPFHFYVLFVFKLLMGRNLWALRLSASLFGVASVYLIMRLSPYIGRFTAYTAAFFAAVSPGLVFYSRYAIHESELLFFSILALLGFFRQQTENDLPSLWLIGLGVAGMVLTKETFIIHVGTFAIAWGILKFYERFFPSTGVVAKPKPKYKERDLWLVTGVCGSLVVLFYSGVFLNLQGVNDLFRSFSPWYNTGQKGNGHDKPFWYWMSLFSRYEWLAFAGLVLTPKFLFPSSRWLRLIALYGFGCFLAYSIVHYKTPWCVMQIIWPFQIVAASILGDLTRHGNRATFIAVGAALVFGLASSAKAIHLNFFKYADENETYVYVQTFPEIMDIMAKLKKITAKDPTHLHSRIVISLDSDWPIPWLLGEYTKVGYFGVNLPADPNGILALIDGNQRFLFEQRVKKEYFVQRFRLRNSKGESYAYFDTDVFKDYFSADSLKVKPSQ